MMRPRSFIVLLVATCLTAILAGCPTTQVVSSPPPRVDQADSQVAGCLVAKDPLNPFIVEWPGTEKVALGSASRDGLVVVSYVSCYLKVLRGCKGVGVYDLREETAAVDGFEITSQNDLYARLPLGAASLQAEVSSGSSLKLNYLATGQRVAKSPPQKLEGECAGATHYVRAMTVGAYGLDVVSSASAGGGAGVGGLGAEAGRKESVRRIRGQGNIEQCQITGVATKGCDAVLQLELSPIASIGAAAGYAPLPRAEGAGPVATAPAWQPQTPAAPSVDDLKKLKHEAALIQKAADEAKTKAETEERRRRDLEAKAKAGYLARCEEGWKAASETADMTAVASKTRIGALQAFLDRFKTDNPHEAEAKACIASITKNAQAGCGGSSTGAAGLEWVYSAPAKVKIAKTEATVAQYRACFDAGKCTKPKDKNEQRYCNWGYSDRDSHPINCVDWNQAAAFCEWAGGRLPTEEEWFAEASNGGSRQYPWGDAEVTCDYAVWGAGKNDGCGKDSTWPVCSKTAGNSVCGLCDMSGNVWEWTSSWYDSQAARVLRGGSWDYGGPENLGASGRHGYDPSYGDYVVGFRCASSGR